MELVHIYTHHNPPEKIHSRILEDTPNNLKLIGYKFTNRCFLFGWYKVSNYVMSVIEHPQNNKSHVAGVMCIPYEYIITTPKWFDKAIIQVKQKIQKYVRKYRRNTVSTDLSY